MILKRISDILLLTLQYRYQLVVKSIKVHRIINNILKIDGKYHAVFPYSNKLGLRFKPNTAYKMPKDTVNG